MLDTNTLSYIVHEQSSAAVLALDSANRDRQVCLSSIAEGEILYGLARNPAAVRLRSVMTSFLGELRILPWGREEARAYGNLRAAMQRNGHALASLDMLIAAHALAADATLVTRDNAFSHVPGLNIENWATDL